MAHIKTYARIKPTKQRYDDYEVTDTTLYMRIPDTGILRDANGRARMRMCTLNHEFKFTQIFRERAAQEEVFNVVARDIIAGFLNGYNGTIFAYGQTGTGKTYTVEGTARRYDDRGLAPRALSMIYQELEGQSDTDASIHISYMEIYQEVGYDLLNQAARSSSAVTPFPKVAVVEGTKGTCVVRNLSSHLAANEDVAQSLLLQGQANRKVAETTMNQRSSRSHAVLTITLTAKKQNAEIITKSKLHLVDLAGSERVSKTGIDGQQLAEAKYINLSLHHLEGVIIALHQEATGSRPHTAVTASYSSFYKKILAERSHPYKRPKRNMGSPANLGSGHSKFNSSSWSTGRPSSADGYRNLLSSGKHVPYRNSLLTMVLRDSLGGNCQTAMIATISMEEENLGESISTCRFSQRVACITNIVRKNEEIDDKLMIKRLRKRIAELETELSLLQASQGNNGMALVAMDSKLTDEDKMDCARIVQSYLGGRINDPIVAGITSPLRFRECMKIFRAMVIKHYSQSENRQTFASPPVTAWEETNESRPATVPNNLKKARERDSKSPTMEMSTSSSGKEVTERNSKAQLSTSKQVVHSTTGVTNRPQTVMHDVDHIMSHLSLGGQRDSQSRDSSARVSTSQGWSNQKLREAYKSPFERKREKTIKMLTQQVEKKRSEQKEDKLHLEQFQHSVREQQLTTMLKDISVKLEQTKSQLANQHALVKQIKAEGKNEALYKQEKTVERQLRKRQAKMERRLQLINEHFDLVEKHQGELDKKEEKSKSKVNTSKDTKPQLGVTSRMVLDKLQEEDRTQQKAQTQIEHQRMLALTQHVEAKEAATRQKLQEFKMRLRQSKTEGGNISRLGLAANGPEKMEDKTAAVIVDVERDDEPSTAVSPSHGTTFSIKMNLKNVKEPSGTHRPPQPSVGSPFGRLQNYDYVSCDRKSNKKNLENLWDKSYSSSRQNSATDRLPSSDPFTGSPVKSDQVKELTSVKLEISPVKAAGYEDLPAVLDSRVVRDDSFQSDLLESRSDPFGKNLEWPSGEGSDPKNTQKSSQTDQRPNAELFNNINATDNEKSRQKVNRGAKQSRSEVFMPSEYINQNLGKRFDARKMGLSNKTFESALNSMLASEECQTAGPLTISHGEYDEYARSPRQAGSTAKGAYTAKVKVHIKSPDRGRKKEKDPTTAKKVMSPPPSVTQTTWGPGSKNMAMSDRLARYLEMDTLPGSPIQPGQGHSFEDADINPYKKPQVIDDSATPDEWWKKQQIHQEVPDIDIDDYVPKIKALPEKKREVTYMSTVKEQKDRVSRIRRARRAAEVIQKAWRNYKRPLSFKIQ